MSQFMKLRTVLNNVKHSQAVLTKFSNRPLHSLTQIRASFKKLYEEHLLLTNTISTGALLGVGDFLVQRSNITYHKVHHNETISYDKWRTARMITIGFVLGPFNHFWYQFLDKMLKGRTAQTVGKKIICDQFVAGPFFCSSFLLGMGLLEGLGDKKSLSQSWNNAASEWKDKFLDIYAVDWCFWPLAQVINFRFIPGQFRVLYVNCATLVWNSILSYLKHREIDESDYEELRTIRRKIDRAAFWEGRHKD